MTHSHRVIITVTVGLIVNFVMTGVFAQTRTPDEAAARAKAIAENFEQNARQLTVFDRQGRVVNVIGTRDMYTQPSLSSDNTRVAVIKGDLEKETADVWVLDAATGNGVRLTSNQSREPASTPVWSPDGSEVAYVALRGSYYGLYRKASNGQGPEELLYQHPGGPISFTGWSLDGRFLNFSAINDLSGGLMCTRSRLRVIGRPSWSHARRTGCPDRVFLRTAASFRTFRMSREEMRSGSVRSILLAIRTFPLMRSGRYRSGAGSVWSRGAGTEGNSTTSRPIGASWRWM